MCMPGICGEETDGKERDFRAILRNQLNICNNIDQCQRYHYIDPFGGLGVWDCKQNGRMKGSPVIFQESVQEIFNKEYKGDIIEENRNNYNLLIEHLFNPRIYSHFGNSANIIDDDIEFFENWQTYGLLYCDPPMTPETIDLSFEMMSKISRRYRMVDVMIYIGPAWIKRVERCGGQLSQGMAKVNKNGWVIRELRGRAQYTFLIGTNWTRWAEWASLGFYNINSSQGKKIFEIADHTNEELKEKKRQLQIPLPLIGLMENTSNIQSIKLLERRPLNEVAAYAKDAIIAGLQKFTT